MVLAVTYPWAPASSYLSSQSARESRCKNFLSPAGPLILFSFLLRAECRSCPVCTSGVCGCDCEMTRGDGARGGGSVVVGSPKLERGCG